jgi:hypothetical protein
MYLVKEGYLAKQQPLGRHIPGAASVVEYYYFTEAGMDFVQRWAAAQPLDPSIDERAIVVLLAVPARRSDG